METERIIAFIFIVGVILYQRVKINKLKNRLYHTKCTSEDRSMVIELQQQTIKNQTETIKSYKEILGKGVDITTKEFTEKQLRDLVNSVTEFMSHHEPEEFNEWFEKKMVAIKK